MPKAHFVQLILQNTRLQTQLGKAVLFDRFNDPVHLSVVRRGEMGKVHMWRNKIMTQDVGVEVSQDLFCIPADRKGQNHNESNTYFVPHCLTDALTKSHVRYNFLKKKTVAVKLLKD